MGREICTRMCHPYTTATAVPSKISWRHCYIKYWRRWLKTRAYMHAITWQTPSTHTSFVLRLQRVPSMTLAARREKNVWPLARQFSSHSLAPRSRPHTASDTCDVHDNYCTRSTQTAKKKRQGHVIWARCRSCIYLHIVCDRCVTAWCKYVSHIKVALCSVRIVTVVMMEDEIFESTKTNWCDCRL